MRNKPSLISVKGKKTRYFAIAAIVSFIAGVMFFFLGGWFHSRPLFIVFWGVSFVAAPALGIVASFVSYGGKTLKMRLLLTTVTIILSMLVLLGGRAFLVEFLPYIYTPPAITPNNIAVYKECIQFVRNHDSYKNLRLLRGLLFDGRKRIETQDGAIEIKVLCHRLYGIRCIKLQRDSNMVLFYKMANSVFPGFPPSFLSVMPESPGVLYSLKGKDPNEIDSEVLNAVKPFTRIYGNWYMSRRLMLAGPRADIPVSSSKSLIDNSLRIDAVNPDELHGFD
ncbi:hypothetical protein ES703_33373 [subsurface metagenome]